MHERVFVHAIEPLLGSRFVFRFQLKLIHFVKCIHAFDYYAKRIAKAYASNQNNWFSSCWLFYAYQEAALIHRSGNKTKRQQIMCSFRFISALNTHTHTHMHARVRSAHPLHNILCIYAKMNIPFNQHEHTFSNMHVNDNVCHVNYTLSLIEMELNKRRQAMHMQIHQTI